MTQTTEATEATESYDQGPSQLHHHESGYEEAQNDHDAEQLEESNEGQADEQEPQKPTKTVSELEHEHYERICEKNLQVREAGADYDEAKAEANQLKKRFDRLTAELSDLIVQDPRQHRLPFTENEQGEQAVAVEDLYKSKSTYELGLPVGLTEKLVDAGLGTLGELQDFWQSGKQLADITGIGEEKSAQVVDAFSEYGRLHPELFGDAAEADEEPAPSLEDASDNEATTDEQLTDEDVD